jgi:hypothetical protein
MSHVNKRRFNMKFNLWLVIFLALMPVFILFTGLSAAGGFLSPADWPVIGTVLATAIVVGCLANRRGDEISEETSREATVVKDAVIPVGESDPVSTMLAGARSIPSRVFEPRGGVVPAFRPSFDERERNVTSRATAVRMSSDTSVAETTK